MEIHLVSNQTEKCNYNLNWDWFNAIPKRFLSVYASSKLSPVREFNLTDVYIIQTGKYCIGCPSDWGVSSKMGSN